MDVKIIAIVLFVVWGNTIQAQTDTIRHPLGAMYYPIEKEPVFPGGEVAMMKYFVDHIDVSYLSADQIIPKLYLTFTIDTNGKAVRPSLVGKEEGFDYLPIENQLEELIANMPLWEPGIIRGQKAAIYMYYSIHLHTE